MSQWHRAHPELVGTDADPWMAHESYRKVAPIPGSERERLREERELAEEPATQEDIEYEKAQLSQEWEDRHGGGL